MASKTFTPAPTFKDSWEEDDGRLVVFLFNLKLNDRANAPWQLTSHRYVVLDLSKPFAPPDLYNSPDKNGQPPQ